MNIVLTGFMGTGKTAVGRQVADKLKIAFIDIDSEISKRAGKSITDIFASSGEAAFRQLERDVIAELTTRDRTVLATGGGALLDETNRQNLGKQGILVCLRARTSTLMERLKDDVTRPLLAGENLEQKLARLLKERQAVYDCCAIQVDTDTKTIPQVADEIIEKVSPQWA